jgi:hypothetical protein
MNQIEYRTVPANRAMNAVLWTTQVLMGIFWCVTGFGKACCIDVAVWNHMLTQVPWFAAVPRALFVFIGVCEFLGGVGLILPAMTGLKPKLTPIAAFGLTLIMIFAAVFHIVRGEYNFYLPTNLVLGGISAFLGYGRLLVKPTAPASVGTFRVLKGLAVLGALVFVGFAPVWYQLTHIHS